MQEISQAISSIERNVKDISRLHEKALVAINSEDAKRVTRQVDALQQETNAEMDRVRGMLSKLSRETKQMTGHQVGARKSQQSNAAKKLMAVARLYEEIQEKYKNKYKQRIAREIKIARPDATQDDIEHAVEHGGAVFAQQMLSGRQGEQRRVLQDVTSRHREIEKIEQSVEQLATLFQDMQALLEQQQETINIVEAHVESAQGNSILT
jgi:syntaxin 1B/2/3